MMRRPPGRKVVKLNNTVLTGGALVLVGLAISLYWFQPHWHATPASRAKAETLPQRFQPLPEVITRPVVPKPAPVVPPKPPVAEYTTRNVPIPPVQQASLVPTDLSRLFTLPTLPPLPPQPAAPVTPPAQPVTTTPAPGAGTPAGAGQTAPPAEKPEKPKRKEWAWLATGEGDKAEAPGARKEEDKEKLAALGTASGLITPAKTAIPAYPLKTIYRSQTLIGRLAQAVNSDIPGQVKIELMLPLYDKFGYDSLILDKGTLIIASQEGKAQYGNTRLPLKLEQVELLNGEVVAFKATIGDQEGANGVAGHVNNHYGKLLLATGLSAILNIGVRTATGTPSGFYQNPAQQSAQDIGQDVQSSASEVIKRELKLPPTIEIPAGTNVTVNLGENITFSRKPVVIK